MGTHDLFRLRPNRGGMQLMRFGSLPKRRERLLQYGELSVIDAGQQRTLDLAGDPQRARQKFLARGCEPIV